MPSQSCMGEKLLLQIAPLASRSRDAGAGAFNLERLKKPFARHYATGGMHMIHDLPLMPGI